MAAKPLLRSINLWQLNLLLYAVITVISIYLTRVRFFGLLQPILGIFQIP